MIVDEADGRMNYRKLPLISPPVIGLSSCEQKNTSAHKPLRIQAPPLAFLVFNSFYYDVLKLSYQQMKNLFRSTCAAIAGFETVFLFRL